MQNKKFDISKVNLGIDNIAEKVKDVEAKADFGLMNIPLNKIRFNPKNNFGMRDIEGLADSMNKYGQVHNIVVRPIESTDEYELISGERRCRAALMLEWNTIAAKVVNVDDVDAEIMLIIANLDTRELNDIERSKNAMRLTELVQNKRKQGEKFGGKKTREVVADKMGIAPATVQKLIKLKELIPELKKMVEDGDIPLESSNQYAQMPVEAQKAIYEALKTGTLITAKQAKQLKDSIQKNKEDFQKQLDNTIKEKDKEIEDANNKVKSIENEKEIAVKQATDKAKAEFDSIKNELDIANKEIQRQKEEAKGLTDKLKAELKAELEKNKSEEETEAIKELKAKLKQAEGNELKLKDEADKRVQLLEEQLESITEDKNKVIEDYNSKLKELENKKVDAENIERNIEIMTLAKQGYKVMNILLIKMLTYKEKEKFILSDEAKKEILKVLEYQDKVSDNLGK